jgi:hypothetical protein
MIINPITITLADHELVEAINALQRVVDKLTPNSPTHRRFENALLSMIDAREGAIKRRAAAKENAQ